MDVNKEREEIEKIDSEITNLRDSRAQRLGTLREALKSGNASSGNIIKDFATVYFGRWNNETIEHYRELEKQVNENIGREVLVIKKEKREREMFMRMVEGFGCGPEPTFYISDIELRLGVISSPLELNVQTGEVIIPAKNHAKTKITGFEDLYNFWEKTEWEKIEESIKNKYDELPHLFGKPVKNLLSQLGGFRGYGSELTSEIIIGDEVKSYFKKTVNGKKAYSEARILLDPNLGGTLF